MLDVLCVFGTRPEAIKVAPVVEALRALNVTVTVLVTGQHTGLLDPNLMRRLGPVATLGVASDGSMLRFSTRACAKLREAVAQAAPRAILVQGDTMSGFVGARVAQELGIPLAHVEAGVRSGNRSEPWPEEITRRTIDEIATWLYAPTQRAYENLRRDGFAARAVITGNTSVDALMRYTDVRPRAEAAPTLFVTLHRRELRERPDALGVLQALVDTVGASHVSAVWPAHPAMIELANKLRLPPNFSIRPPMVHSVALAALSEARGLLTDSGGLVEEAATLGVPTAILRGANDRPEAVEAGIAQVFAPTPSGAQGAVQILATCAIPRRATCAYGDGRASERIAAHLANALELA